MRGPLRACGVLLLATPAGAFSAATPEAALTVRGFVLGSGQWGAAGLRLDAAADALRALRAAGASWVRLSPTGYFASACSTKVYT